MIGEEIIHTIIGWILVIAIVDLGILFILGSIWIIIDIFTSIKSSIKKCNGVSNA